MPGADPECLSGVQDVDRRHLMTPVMHGKSKSYDVNRRQDPTPIHTPTYQNLESVLISKPDAVTDRATFPAEP